MASLMDDIMRQYRAPLRTIGGVVPPSGAPTRDMFSPQRMGADMPDFTLGSQPGLSPTAQQKPFGLLPQFNPMAQGDVGVFGPPMPQSPFGSLPQLSPMPQGGAALGQAGADMVMRQNAANVGLPTSNIPMPPSRPALPGRTPGFLDQLLSGPNYQSNNMPVDVRAQGPSMPGQQMPLESINYGDPNSAADFFRADQLMMQNPNIPGFLGGY